MLSWSGMLLPPKHIFTEAMCEAPEGLRNGHQLLFSGVKLTCHNSLHSYTSLSSLFSSVTTR